MLNCFRYLDLKTISAVDSMLLFEYKMLMKAYSLNSLDRDYQAHKQAWINQQVKASKEQGKKTVPVYRNFKQFFDYEKMEQEILGTKTVKNKKEKPSEFARMLRKANS